jgi:hypothetical protein
MAIEKLLKEYIDRIEVIKKEIQGSELLETYLDSESDEDYRALADEFEPRLMEIHAEVNNHFPLEIEAFENKFTDEGFEGLMLPRLMGFSVLRGHYDENYKYTTPQDHFKELLLAVANSSNFDNIVSRIGQTVQLGFALSSDIWITNLMDEINNKRVKQWMNDQKLDKYYMAAERQKTYTRYKNQFRNYNYATSKIPTTPGDFKLYYPSLKYFLFQRQKMRLDNSNIKPAIVKLLQQTELSVMHEYNHILFILMNYFNLSETESKAVYTIFNKDRKDDPNMVGDYFDFLLEMYDYKIIFGPDNDKKMQSYIDPKIKDNILAYYVLVNDLHAKGFMHADVIEGIKEYLSKFNGLSNESEAIRRAVLRYFREWINNAGTEDYNDFFEFFKVYRTYMDLFNNESFNQALKHSAIDYIHRLMKHYTDKRGKDYQDIKKFVMNTFTEVDFMNEKEATEYFKTKRKVKKV